MTNPYESPSTAPVNHAASKATGWFSLLAFLYPALLVGAMYATWLIAWLVLGRMPRPSLDDPKSISVIVDIPYYCVGILLVGFPPAALAGVVIQLTMPGPSWVRRLIRCAAYVLCWYTAIALIRWDPWRVVEWYMD